MKSVAFIEVDNLSKRYGPEVRALQHVSFTIARGEWVAAMGPSGSGKSTLLNILGCLDTPDEGRVIVDGQDLIRFSASERASFRAERIGFVFQQYHLVPYLSALENVMLAQYFHSLADESEAAEALRRVGLGARLRHLPSELSGGEQQRVCIARALINQPNLILADEPTGNLDEVNEAIVLSLFADLHREGRTVLMVTHDPEVARMGDRRIELHHGRLTEPDIFIHQDQDLFDQLLKAVWKARGPEGAPREEGRPVRSENLSEFVHNRATFNLLAERGWLRMSEGTVDLTPRGEERARYAVRRHRLAERLFYETFGIHEDLLHENALKIDSVLSPEVTQKICTFLHHPRTCPHGDPIPPGDCCRLAGVVH
jgi:putative ABC transport system ATP-binding protein